MTRSYLDGIEIACNGNIDANIGDWETWDGRTVLILMAQIERLYNRLWTKRTSRLNLETRKARATKTPSAVKWTSFFIRELVGAIRNFN